MYFVNVIQGFHKNPICPTYNLTFVVTERLFENTVETFLMHYVEL